VLWCIFLKSTFIRLHFYPAIELKNLIAILRIILCEGEIWSVALRDELGVESENGVLRGMFGLARDGVTLEWQ
jgi:hypothetical protein